MDLGLQGKIAIITGGSEGIGKATALRLCEEGAHVAICARRPDVLQRAADEIKARTGGEVLAVPADVSSDEQVHNLVQKTVERYGAIDILVNNAGGHNGFPFLEASEDIWRADLEIKLYGAIRCCKAVIPHMLQRGGGRIINMTTVTGKVPRAKLLPTSVSRAAGINLTKALANEYAAENILVNTICLGSVKSAQWERRFAGSHSGIPQHGQTPTGLSLEAQHQQAGKNVPVGRIAEAEEAADLIAFLVSKRAAFITGTAINFDGGASAVV
jgi:NAD(P)-dependent dehydrogenase (short-subunit alcohol dehydrogenase family)